MVLLHGLYENARSWAAFADASTRPCVAFDLPGFGASTLPRANANYGDYADAIAQGIAQLQLQDFEIIGHSFGGAVAAALAERELKSVRALTLVATCGFGRQHIPELLRAPALRTFMDITVPLALANPFTAAAIYMAWVSNNKPPSASTLTQLMRAGVCARAGASAGVAAIVAGGVADDAFYRQRLRYRGRVRVLWGACDRLVPRAHLRGIACAYPQAEITVWERTGHHPRFEHAHAFADYINEHTS
jgi:pyruvate dehydrogenase E2 component (dihydrolipoamide acetyltransferase)